MKRVLGFIFIFAVLHSALASVSLSTGVVLPSWDQLRTGQTVDEAKRIIRDYSLQLGISCILQDVHTKKNAHLISRSIHVDTWFESSGSLQLVLEDRNQHVLIFEPRLGYNTHLVVVFQIDSDLLLVAC